MLVDQVSLSSSHVEKVVFFFYIYRAVGLFALIVLFVARKAAGDLPIEKQDKSTVLGERIDDLQANHYCNTK